MLSFSYHLPLTCLLLTLSPVKSIVWSCDGAADSCSECVSDYDWLGSCVWCPSTSACASQWSVRSCTKHSAITNAEACSRTPRSETPGISHENRPLPAPYNETLAFHLALWSSLTYVIPGAADPTSFTRLVQQRVSREFEEVSFITGDCSLLFDYDRCGLLVAVSRRTNRLVIAYRGTKSFLQLLEEVGDGITSLVDFPAGGSVLRYLKHAHDDLYGCLVTHLTSALTKQQLRDMRVDITGHSLGAGLAQLSALSLIKDGLLSADRVSVTTFGGLRVGNQDFADEYNKLPPTKAVTAEDRMVHTNYEVFYPNTNMTRGSPYVECVDTQTKAKTCSTAYSLVSCFYTNCMKFHMNYFIPVTAFERAVRSGHLRPVKMNSTESCLHYHYPLANNF